MRDTAHEFHDFEAARNFALGVVKGLAVLFGDRFGDRIMVLHQKVAKLEHHLGTLGRRCRRPARQCRSRAGDCCPHLVAGCQSDLFDHLAGGRVEDVAAAPAPARDDFAVDEMMNFRAHVATPFIGLLSCCADDS